MVIYSRSFVLTRFVHCATKKTIARTIMLKRSLQSPPKKKLKANQGLSKTPSASDSVCNLNTNLVESEKMEVNNHNVEKVTDPLLDEILPERPQVKFENLETPIKSENDKKEYRVIKLENGLTALLIADLHSRACVDNDDGDNDEGEAEEDLEEGEKSDDEDDEEKDSEQDDEGEEEEEDEEDDDDEEEEEEEEEEDDDDQKSKSFSKRLKREEKMAACGLSVGVGSFSDPSEIPGMAHFLEHMVFMGSEKYPEENAFDAFVKKRGGSDNASTECEHTTFYFEVQEKYFLPALDRFAQFFIKPLMKRDAIARERKAVESEFQMALPSDIFRKEQLFGSLARPNHPATKFGWGNLITLRDNVTDEKLYEELHKFRERHYSAHRMKLAIQARLPLHVLENYVTQCFGSVPNNDLPPDDFNEFKGAESFNTTSFRKIYKIKPMKDIFQVELTWAMPPLHDLYKSKPHQYVSWIIGHEGKGSVISYLRKKMWCIDIFSGNGESGFEHSSMYALFSLSLILTDEGHQHLQDVLNAIFSYINLMRQEGPQKRIYDEIHQIEEMIFRFVDEDPPAEYVEDLCTNMHMYPPRDYITGSNLYFKYNPDAIRKCMDYLSPDNVNIMIFDKNFDDDKFDKVEPWFKTKYTDMPIPKEWIECWRTISPLPEFHLPLPNVYITDDFSLIPIPADLPKHPMKIHADDIIEIWYRPDPKFALPECYMYLYLISPMAVSSPKNAAFTDLFVGMLGQLLIEELYPATAAELTYEISTSEMGIVVKLNGFNQKLPLVLTTIAKYIANCSSCITKELFEVMKKEQKKKYYNRFLKPGKLAQDVERLIIMHLHWPLVDKHAAISTVEFHEFQYFLKYFTNHIYIQSLVQGNMTKEDAIKNVISWVDILKCGPLQPNTMPQLRVSKIPPGKHYCMLKNFNNCDVNSIVTNYYQSGIGTIKLSVKIELLIMIMEEPLFNQLRTQEQLGYNVFCVVKDTFGILGYSISVCTQADKYTTEHADERIETFLQDFKGILRQTSVEELECVKEALIKAKQYAEIHLKEEVDRNWNEIISCEYMFDRIENELAAIEHIKIDELREWVDAHTAGGKNLRNLSVHVIGSAAKSTDNDNNDDTLHTSNTKTNACNSNTESGEVVKYPLRFLPRINPKKPGFYIADIQDFKSKLYIYPINLNLNRTAL